MKKESTPFSALALHIVRQPKTEHLDTEFLIMFDACDEKEEWHTLFEERFKGQAPVSEIFRQVRESVPRFDELLGARIQ